MIKNIKKYLVLIAIFFIFSCATSKNNIFLEKSKDDLSLQYAYLDYENNRIYVEQKVNNDYYIINGDAENLLNPQYIDTRILGELFINLDEVKLKSEEKEIKNKKLVKLEAVTKKEYGKIIDPAIHKVIFDLVPKQKNRGIVLVFKDKELVFYRNKRNEIKVTELIHKPKYVKVEKYYSKNKYIKTVFGQLKTDPVIKSKMKNNLLLFEASSEFLEYSMGVLDFDNNEVYYISCAGLTNMNQGRSGIAFGTDFLGSLVLKSHFITPLKNPVTSAHKMVANVWYTLWKPFQDRGRKNYNIIPELNKGNEMMNLAEFNKLLDKRVSKEVYKAKVDFFIGGDEFFPELITSIQEAKKSIDFRIYIFDNDEYAVQIADLLRKKADEDVENQMEVRVLQDSLANIIQSGKYSEVSLDNNHRAPNNMKNYIRTNSRAESRTTPNIFLTSDHTKSIIFDDKITYIGGMNIGKEYRYFWHDMMVKLDGPISQPIKKEFDKSWTATGWTGDLGLLFVELGHKKIDENASVSDDMIDVRLLYTKPSQRDIYKAQLYAIKKAKKYIYIENPYLADLRIIKALIRARQRGVDVRVILPEKNNIAIMHSNNMAVTNLFIKNGVRVYHYPAMTHIKASIYDGWASVGSANFDKLSFDKNLELNVAFSDKKIVSRLKKRLFEKDFSLSKEITEPVPVFWKDKRVGGIANYL